MKTGKTKASLGRSKLHPACVQIYTGNGKGKTTAALGLALRAVGAGLRVLFAQFLKGRSSSELAALRRFRNQIRVVRCGRPGFIRGKPAPADMTAARNGWKKIQRILARTKCDIVILDELNLALHHQLLDLSQILDFIAHRPPGMEVIITGRSLPKQLAQKAELITEMREVKHYYRKGIPARKGIEW